MARYTGSKAATIKSLFRRITGNGLTGGYRVLIAFFLFNAASGWSITGKKEFRPNAKCVICRYDADETDRLGSNLYLADLNSGKVDELLSLGNFKIEKFATDPEREEVVVAGFCETPRGVRVTVSAGRFSRFELNLIFYFETGFKYEPEFSVAYDALSTTFYVSYTYTTWFYYEGLLPNGDPCTHGFVDQPKSFIVSYSPRSQYPVEVSSVDEYISLEWGALADGKVGFSFYDKDGEELKGYGYFDPATGEFIYPVDIVLPEYKTGFMYLSPVGAPDEGCNIQGTYFNENGGRKDIYLSDKVIAGPVTSGKGEALVYIIRDRDTTQAKLKVKSIETGEEFVLDLPYDPEPALSSRYRLFFVE